ncbi:DUF3159 domain-containing protein [Paeniglutamicibacter sp. NPDC012692]|uniref:DUF3159 domain-containing protein n=1 Tax=Paeniglutamicibacter sp. NPDC012692 TaxID=3364388 RepID=UPI0036AF12B1
MSDPTPNTPEPEEHAAPSAEEIAARIGANAGIERREDGQIDVLKTIGGVRGLIESLLPGLVFLSIFILSQQLNIALIASVAVALGFTVARLVRRGTLVQALTGLGGVVICAVVSRATGEAKDYYVPGFYTNIAYGAALVISILVRWPLMGVIFGFIRSENTVWRADKIRARQYAWATWIVVAVFAARLAVQVPLYFADNIAALGAARLAMGVPLYAAGLWVAWMISRPLKSAEAVAETPPNS